MSKPTVAYSTFCCPKDIDRVMAIYSDNCNSHKHAFDEHFLIMQRCTPGRVFPFLSDKRFFPCPILDEDYPEILGAFGIQWPNPVLDELTHGWGAPHFFAHHLVNHLKTLQLAKSDYIVFADGDCYIKESPSAPSWVERGIEILESDPRAFVVSPNDGGHERYESIMSQQMFLINRKRFLEMEFIPWDGKFIEGGPFQEYYGLLEGWIARYMAKNNLFRYVLPPTYRYWHLAFH